MNKNASLQQPPLQLQQPPPLQQQLPPQPLQQLQLQPLQLQQMQCQVRNGINFSLTPLIGVFHGIHTSSVKIKDYKASSATTNIKHFLILGSLILLALGWNLDDDERSDLCQVLDTESSNSCPDLAQYPIQVENAVGGLVDDTPVICGGTVCWQGSCPRVDPCYKHDRTTNTWSLLGNLNRARGFHAAAPLLGGSVLWVTGKDLDQKVPILKLIVVHLYVQHTSQNSFYKWTKISSLEIDIFDLKMKAELAWQVSRYL